MRTPARNWKYGQTDMNVLFLAVIWRGVASPLLYELLPHGGGSHTEIRHTLMDDALCLHCAGVRVYPESVRMGATGANLRQMMRQDAS